MLNKLIHSITLKLIDYCERKGKVFVINGKDSNDAYLIRYLLVQSNLMNVYIHRFLRSDHDVPHDHPWDFLTYVVDGKYVELKFPGWEYQAQWNEGVMVARLRKKGSIAFRKATDIHKVRVDELLLLEDKERAPLTICITGPRRRVWGFWELGQGRFTRWTNYLNINDDSKKRG